MERISTFQAKLVDLGGILMRSQAILSLSNGCLSSWQAQQSMRSRAMKRSGLGLLFSLFTAASFAQIGGKGAIEGTVVDPTGAVVSGAVVTAKNVGTSVATTRTTTSSGYFVLSPLDPGGYTVSVAATGFEGFIQEHITLDAIQTIGLQITLKVGAPSESVTVSAAPAALGTENATLGVCRE